MNKEKSIPIPIGHADEAAVDGLLSGLLAGTAMALVLILGALTMGRTYGLALLLVAKLILLPGSGSALGQIPLAYFALAHGIYGLVLGPACNPGVKRPQRLVE